MFEAGQSVKLTSWGEFGDADEFEAATGQTPPALGEAGTVTRVSGPPEYDEPCYEVTFQGGAAGTFTKDELEARI